MVAKASKVMWRLESSLKWVESEFSEESLADWHVTFKKVETNVSQNVSLAASILPSIFAF